MKQKNNLFTLILIASIATMSSAFDDEDTLSKSETATMLIEPLLKLTAKVYDSEKSQDNVILSPISIHKALNLVLLGADPSSRTESELIDSLGYKGLTSDDINKCHEEYSKIVAKFKQITNSSLEFKSQQRREGGKSPDCMFGCDRKEPPILDIFNMVITKNKGEVLPAFEDKIKKYYDSSIVKIDDQKPETKSNLTQKLNNWAKEAGFEQPLMGSSELDKEFAAILLSAIRVEGFWFDELHEFDGKQIFHNYGRRDQPVDGKALFCKELRHGKYIEFTSAEKANYKILHSRLSNSSSAKLFSELSNLNFHVAEIPLVGDLSFTIFEPLGNSEAGGDLKKLVGQLLGTQQQTTSEPSNLSKTLALLDGPDGGRFIDRLQFPKFSFENELDLKRTLQSVGLNRVFDRTSAEVSNMTRNKVYVDKITHQAMIDVNKFGIKAAGVTKIKLAFLSSIHSENPIRLDIKNPFMFMLRYERLPLFVGQLVKL